MRVISPSAYPLNSINASFSNQHPRMQQSYSQSMGQDTVKFGQIKAPKWLQGTLAALFLGTVIAGASGCGLPKSQAPCGEGVSISVVNGQQGALNVVNPGYSLDSNHVGTIYSCTSDKAVFGTVKNGVLSINGTPVARVNGDGYIDKYENGKWVRIAYYGDSSITYDHLPKYMNGLYLLDAKGNPDVQHPLGTFDKSSWNLDYSDAAMILVRVLLMTPNGQWDQTALNAQPSTPIAVAPVKVQAQA